MFNLIKIKNKFTLLSMNNFKEYTTRKGEQLVYFGNPDITKLDEQRGTDFRATFPEMSYLLDE